MPRALSALVGLGLAFAATSAAADERHVFERCEKAEIEVVLGAMGSASKISLQAAVSIGDTPEFRRWFGPYSKENAGIVRAAFKSIHAALRDQSLKIVCANVGEEDCDAQMYANVWSHDAYVINLCPAFFGMPELHVHPSTSVRMENGTREGTIIHELSHFDIVAGTEDICYSRPACAQLAEFDRVVLVRNADSYQYFAEDVAYLRASR
ncbi:M35 family metallo-endopeptidase [Histidinibacterium lentulum]|nr:M35 family metallo-endopeptidase [Histidinibacterium lentulum]